jgi:hypothetical protein
VPIIIMAPQAIRHGMPAAIIAVMALQRSRMVSIWAASMGISLQVMPSLPISQVILHIMGIIPPIIIGAIIAPPIIMGFMPPIMFPIMFAIMGFIIPIMGFIIPFIIGFIMPPFMFPIMGMGIIIGVGIGIGTAIAVFT